MDNSIIKATETIRATETITTSTAPAMPAEASPRPWRVEKSPANSNFWVVRCDTGVSVATAWYEADARLIVEAVNQFTHRENAPLPSARGAELSSASRPTGAELSPAVTAGETASMLLPWTVEGPFPGRRRTKKHDGFAAYANIVNRIGTYVAQGLPPEVAAGIVEAVNGMDAWQYERRRLQLAAASAENAFVNADARRTLLERHYCEVFAERDRLRDLVRRLVHQFEGRATYDDEAAIIREAREAVWEDEK